MSAPQPSELCFALDCSSAIVQRLRVRPFFLFKPCGSREKMERRLSSRTFPYGYLVTTSPQSPITISLPTRGNFGCNGLSWCDGRCVQGPGTYSPLQLLISDY